MEITDIRSFIKFLGVTVPDDKEFLILSKSTPIYPENEQLHSNNYERGILLYALIAKYKPQNVLEIGTAKGYSTLCMAWAMHDHNIPGTIYTIDPTLNTKFEIKIDDEINILTTPQLWSKIASTDWLKHIEPLTGYSGEIMSKYKFPKIDFAYIDGHHVFRAVEHDFYAFLNVSSNDFHILFDDYGISDGVTKLIDDDISKNFTCVVIKTNLKQQYQELDLKTIKSDLFPTLVLVSTNFLKNHYNKLYPTHKINDVLKKYRKFEKRWRLRQKINQKLPMLKNISFSKYFRS